MLRKRFHWIEGMVVIALLMAVTWLNRTQAAPEEFVPPESYGSRSATSGYGGQSSETEDNSRRLREGTEISGQTGYFRQDGDGATFVTDDGFELGGLPNLNLERVARTLKTADETSTIRWRVSGTITEFSGRNYLLITRAVYKSAAPPPSPEQISILGEEDAEE
jgi:hypothetical protein